MWTLEGKILKKTEFCLFIHTKTCKKGVFLWKGVCTKTYRTSTPIFDASLIKIVGANKF